MLVLSLAVCLGCSGLSSLMVQNGTRHQAQIEIAIEKPKRNGGPQAFSGSVAPSGEVESVSWFYRAPDSLDVKVTLAGGRKLNRKWTEADYPPGLARGTSGGAFYVLEIKDTGLELRDPNRWARFRRNPLMESFSYLPGCCAVLIAGTGLIVLYARKRKAR